MKNQQSFAYDLPCSTLVFFPLLVLYQHALSAMHFYRSIAAVFGKAVTLTHWCLPESSLPIDEILSVLFYSLHPLNSAALVLFRWLCVTSRAVLLFFEIEV